MIMIYHRLNPGGNFPYGIRVRRNPGFNLVAEHTQTADEIWSRRHTVRLEKRADTYRLLRGADENPLVFKDDGNDGFCRAKGYWGLRLWQASVIVHRISMEPL